MMMRPILFAFVCVLAACGPTRGQRAQSVIENPAGVNCTQNGGKLVIRQNSGLQKGYCLLSDGRSLDIWEYYRQTHP